MNFRCMFNCHNWDNSIPYDVTVMGKSEGGLKSVGHIKLVFCSRCHLTKCVYVSMVRVFRP
jgi:hypothetical protein